VNLPSTSGKTGAACAKSMPVDPKLWKPLLSSADAWHGDGKVDTCVATVSSSTAQEPPVAIAWRLLHRIILQMPVGCLL